jgi:hypothetical protein
MNREKYTIKEGDGREKGEGRRRRKMHHGCDAPILQLEYATFETNSQLHSFTHTSSIFVAYQYPFHTYNVYNYHNYYEEVNSISIDL